MAFAIGISAEEFKHLTPYKLECCLKGNKMKRQMQDEMQHLWWGSYGLSAISVAIDHCFSKKAKSEYIKEPVTLKMFENENLTEEEKYEKELRKALLAEEQWIMVGKQKNLPDTII